MANKIIKIERFYSDGINENTSKIKNVVKIIKSEEIAELKEKIPTLIKEKEVRKESKEVQLEKNIEKTENYPHIDNNTLLAQAWERLPPAGASVLRLCLFDFHQYIFSAQAWTLALSH